MTIEIAILVPVLARPQNVAPLMTNVAAATPIPHRLLFLVEERDAREVAALDREGADYLIVEAGRRRYAQKINDGLRATEEPLLFLAADDVLFHPGWFDTAVSHLSDTIDVVGTRDLTNPRVTAGTHSTHTLVRRSYADQFGTIDEPGLLLHEGYPHEYVDDEFIETAKARGRFAMSDAVVEHLHPYRKLAPVDATYRLAWKGREEGRYLIQQRRALWMSL